MGGAIAAVPFAGSDNSGNAINIGSYAGGNSAGNNATYYKDKIILNYPKDKDYDLNFGIKGDVAILDMDMGTGGASKNFNIIPNIGGGGYVSLTPRGERVQGSLSLPLPIVGLSGDIIRTQKGNTGFGLSYGINAIPIRINVSVSPPEKNQSQKP